MNFKITILDRYIIKKFIGTFFVALALIIVIVIIFDISEKIDDFVDNEVPLREIAFTYYANFIPYFMNMFSVTGGVSEPVAYAITAFTEFGLKPKENQEYLYGVFDFGGGTTDFSFGTYSRADISEKKKYD